MSDILQHELFKHFVVDGSYVDPYDDTYFEGAQLDQLVTQLTYAISKYRMRQPEWPLDEEQLPSYFEAGRNYSLELLCPRDQSIAIFQRAIDLALLARKTNRQLQFLGD